MESLFLKVNKRKIVGRKARGKTDKKILLANLFGQKQESLSLFVDRKEFNNLYKKVGDNQWFFLRVDEKEQPALISEVQKHPLTEQYVHVAFQRVSLKDKIRVAVPVSLIWICVIPKSVVLLIQNQVEIEALPADVPDKFVVDMTKFTKIGDEVLLKDLNYDKTKVKLLVEDKELNYPVVIVQEIKEEMTEKPAEDVVETQDEGQEKNEKIEQKSKLEDRPVKGKK